MLGGLSQGTLRLLSLRDVCFSLLQKETSSTITMLVLSAYLSHFKTFLLFSLEVFFLQVTQNLTFVRLQVEETKQRGTKNSTIVVLDAIQ